MNLVIMGVQGSGKGTQSKTLSEHLKVPHISVGDLFRGHVGHGT
ncbi:MAG TPA: nucleoside monophosphate kinase, partial [Candidatus Sumerlaeota bacterium]|nr:nucleoside monophosphate kinase [Candidatus Sumerlaeota bacterium]